MDAKFDRRFQSFCNSLDALAEARERDLTDSFVLSGTSAKFSITFDLSWKVMKDILIQYYAITGFVTGSPRDVLREAFKANLISDDEWMDMLKVRNELAHDYDSEIVKTYCNTIVKEYIASQPGLTGFTSGIRLAGDAYRTRRAGVLYGHRIYGYLWRNNYLESSF